MRSRHYRYYIVIHTLEAAQLLRRSNAGRPWLPDFAMPPMIDDDLYDFIMNGLAFLAIDFAQDTYLRLMLSATFQLLSPFNACFSIFDDATDCRCHAGRLPPRDKNITLASRHYYLLGHFRYITRKLHFPSPCRQPLPARARYRVRAPALTARFHFPRRAN